MSDDSIRIDVTRRQLLRGAAAVAAATGATGALANCGGPAGMIDAGPVTDYSVGTIRLVMGVYVLRDTNGLYAFTNICTHEGCAISPPNPAMSQPNFNCPCHMSQFDLNGDFVPGSLATRNLAHYAVTISGGNVMVDTSMGVTDRASRTPVA